MPIYEYYCPDNHRIYQFYAKTLAQGRTVPKCPDNPRYRMIKAISAFAVAKKTGEAPASAGPADDPRADAAMAAMEHEFAGVDENDPRAMGRMMRRMAETTGEKIDGEMEEVVRRLEEGTDPEALEEQLAGGMPGEGEDPGAGALPDPEAKESPRRPRARGGLPVRDPKLYDYE